MLGMISFAIRWTKSRLHRLEGLLEQRMRRCWWTLGRLRITETPCQADCATHRDMWLGADAVVGIPESATCMVEG